MGKKGGYFAVRSGKQPGVYGTWAECEAQVKGYPGALHKKFPSFAEAQAWSKGSSSTTPIASTSKPTPYQPTNGTGLSRKREAESELAGAKRQRVDPQTKVHMGILEAIDGRKVYCDGSSLGNGQKGSRAGTGIWWGPGNRLNLSERLPGSLQTNNRAEMYAIARILETDPHPHLPLTICTDSEYTINVFSRWIPGWKRGGWKNAEGAPVKNTDLIRYVLALISARHPTSTVANITFFKVKAHVGIEGNEMADQLAKAGAEQPVVRDRDYLRDADDLHRRLGTSIITPTITVEWEDEDWLTEEELKQLEASQNFD